MNLFIVRDFARTDSSEPSVQVWKKAKKKRILSQEALWQNKLLHVIHFQQRGGRGQHHFSAQHFNRGGGPGTQNFSMGDPFFRGRMSLGQFLWNPIPHVIFQWGPDSLLHQDPSFTRVSTVSGFVCSLFFTSQSTIFQLRDGSICVEQVLS